MSVAEHDRHREIEAIGPCTFGFYLRTFHRKFPDWKQASALDARETRMPPRRPLLPFLDQLARGNTVPKCWDHATKCYRDDDDWLLLEQALK